MKIVRGAIQLREKPKKVICTLGNFDGLHLGHQALIKKVVFEAGILGGSSVVITFHPHPLEILYPDKTFKRLFDMDDQIQQLKELGIDLLVIEPFTESFSRLTPEQFVKEWLCRHFEIKKIVVGHDFGFGANKKGDYKEFMKFSKEMGYNTEKLSPILLDGVHISSSIIRENLEQGLVKKASQFLGRLFYLRGRVIQGDGRGRKLGFPTANLKVITPFVPKSGVYSTWSTIKGKKYLSITNIGGRPTFEPFAKALHLEVFIFDFNHEIYGEEVKLEFCDWIRAEKKFSNKEELIEQIKLDIMIAQKELLESIS